MVSARLRASARGTSTGREAVIADVASTAATRSTCRWSAAAAPTTACCSARSPPGRTRLRIDDDPRADARRAAAAGAATTRGLAVTPVVPDAPTHTAAVAARRSSTRGRTRSARFTDVPVFMWYEVEPTAARHALPLLRDLHQRGRRHADRSPDGDLGPDHRHRVHLQRRSGPRGTDRRPRTIQGPEHEVLAVHAAGAKARHPLLWVVDRQQHGARQRADDACATRRRRSPFDLERRVARSGDGRATRGCTR